MSTRPKMIPAIPHTVHKRLTEAQGAAFTAMDRRLAQLPGYGDDIYLISADTTPEGNLIVEYFDANGDNPVGVFDRDGAAV